MLCFVHTSSGSSSSINDVRLLQSVPAGEWSEHVHKGSLFQGKIAQTMGPDEMGHKRFVTARLVQELLCLQGQISRGLAWEAARWGLKWREKRLCLYNTISRETNGVKRGWIWIKSPINVHFSPVRVLHIQLKLSEAVSWQSCHYKSSRTKLHQVLKMRRVKMSREHDRRPGHDFQ